MTTKTNIDIAESLRPQNFIEHFGDVDDQCVNEDKLALAIVKALEAKDQHNKDTCEKMMREVFGTLESLLSTMEDSRAGNTWGALATEVRKELKTIAKSYGVDVKGNNNLT